MAVEQKVAAQSPADVVRASIGESDIRGSVQEMMKRKSE